MIALSIADISMKERSTIECFFIAQFFANRCNAKGISNGKDVASNRLSTHS